MPYAPGEPLFDKYRVVKYIDHGTFGHVYQVIDQGSLSRALKVLRHEGGISTDEFEQAADRFLQEAQLGDRIQHPNVIRVYSYEKSGDELGLVMEFAPGGSLKDKLQGHRRLTVSDTVRLGLDLCKGLEAIHRQKAVHRDLKPGNILFDEQGRAKIADLGLAQVGHQSGRSQLSASGLSAHPGSGAYKSPEQDQSRDYLEPSSDVFALGCVLFEALTGKLYNENTGARPAELRRDAPAWLDEIIVRMLAVQPAVKPEEDGDLVRRYRTAKLARAALEKGWQQALLEQREAGEKKKNLESELTRLTGEAARQQAEIASLSQEKRQLVEKINRLTAENASLSQSLGSAEQSRQKAEQAALAAHRQVESLAAEKARLEADLAKSAAQVNSLTVNLQKVSASLQALEAERQKEKEAPPKPRPSELTITLAPGVTMEFVRVPAGAFLMGSDPKRDKQAQPDEQPQHTVTLDEYRIGKYPVTNRQYQAFVQASGRKAPGHWKNNTIPAGKENHPVVYVSWQDASDFCAWAAKISGARVRLPSEAEWEKAERGTDGRVYPWGDQAPDAQRCNFNNNVKDTTPVGKYSPQGDSPYFCADMAGNVWEWTRTIWDDKFKYPYKMDDGREELRQENAYRTLRGGAFDSSGGGARCAYRLRYGPDSRNYNFGFRVVLSPVLLS